MTKRNGKWSVQINRKGVRVKTQFTSKALASQWANKVEAEIINGTYENNNELVKLSVRELIDLYYDHAKSKTEHASRLRDECNKILQYPIAQIRLGYLNGKHVASFRDQLLSEGLAKSTVRKYMGLLQRALDIGRKELGIPMTHNPVMLVSKPREDDTRDRILEEDEWERFLEECSKSSVHFLKQLVILARETTCRRSEILRITRYDVNFEKGTLHIPKTKNGSPRTIGLSPRAMEVLKSIPISVDGSYFKSPFKSQSNLPNLVSRAVNRAVKKAGIKNFRLHDVRHMSATDRAEQGWSIVELSAQGGWKTLSQLKRYTHVKGEHLAQKLRQDG
tara:strand:+ start:270 stop:1271 length:1002 start_codon:yes stop_codon:yes gene_type:complete